MSAAREPAPPAVEAVSAATVRPLRQALLRPHQRVEELVYPGDDDPAALHAAVRHATGAIVGVASVAPGAHPHDPRAGDWRLRGMATTPTVRGQGLGALLLSACLEHARAHGGRRVWCTARTTAQGFYAHAGFRTEGAEFDLPPNGPHVIMSRPLG